MSTTLILGGGFGGLSCANELRRLLPGSHRIIVVDQSPEFVIGATKTWVMLGELDPRKALHPRRMLEKRGIDFVQAHINSIDPANLSIDITRGNSEGPGPLKGDYLVIALGADYNMGAVPGLDGAAHSFYDLAGAAKLREELRSFKGGEIVVLIPRAPFKCPPAPYEAALMLADHLKRRKISLKLTVATVEGAPMATAGPEIGAFVRGEMEKAGITYLTQRKTVSVDGARRKITLESVAPSQSAIPNPQSEISYDLLIAIPPHVPPKVVLDSSLKGPNGWIPIDRETCRANDSSVKHGGSEDSPPQVLRGDPDPNDNLITRTTRGLFAIGDCTVSALPGKFKPDVPLVLPKAGVFADAQGIVVARNIALEIEGRSSRSAFDGKGFCYIETGDMHAARGDGSFFEIPHPTMSHAVPDMTHYQAKREWVKSLVKRLLG